ncbi:MAG: hypothetical protein KAV87_39510, partial [Desulfobacteraceae bacterium]|nr:hypothetical protein [Desulfobacteraceae bacterium]
VSTVTGAHGKYVNLPGFIPTGSELTTPDGGGSIRGAVRRVASPNNTGMTPMLFFCCQGGPPTVNDYAYMLGLSDADPYKIVLAKGPIIGGIVQSVEETKILVESSSEYNIGDGLWHHIRMDAIVQPNGDVLIKCYESSLTINDIQNPVWTIIGGFSLAGYIDDVLHINTGQAPLWGGYVGFAFAINEALNRRGAFDGIQVSREAGAPAPTEIPIWVETDSMGSSGERDAQEDALVAWANASYAAGQDVDWSDIYAWAEANYPGDFPNNSLAWGISDVGFGFIGVTTNVAIAANEIAVFAKVRTNITAQPV